MRVLYYIPAEVGQRRKLVGMIVGDNIAIVAIGSEMVINELT